MNTQINIETLISSLDTDWNKILGQIYENNNDNQLLIRINNIIVGLKMVLYPPPPLIFYAFKHFNFKELKVVILGQDPYHQNGQAMGLAFSVFKSQKNPPSLKNIMKEINNNYPNSIIEKEEGDLSYLLSQGVLLLNSSLTVFDSSPGCHLKNWEKFTDDIIKYISDKHKNIVFMLWGNYARSKKILIDNENNCILESTHPSPLSAHKGFLGCQHFIKCNQYLEDNNILPINW
jgi:uracil-DNA glycosylase